MGEIDLVALKGKRRSPSSKLKQRKRFEDAGWALPTRARRRSQGPRRSARRSPGLRRSRHRLRRAAGGALGLVGPDRQRISRLMHRIIIAGLTGNPRRLRFDLLRPNGWSPIKSGMTEWSFLEGSAEESVMALKVAFQMDPIERIDIRGNSHSSVAAQAPARPRRVRLHAGVPLAPRWEADRATRPQPDRRGQPRRPLSAGASAGGSRTFDVVQLRRQDPPFTWPILPPRICWSASIRRRWW